MLGGPLPFGVAIAQVDWFIIVLARITVACSANGYQRLLHFLKSLDLLIVVELPSIAVVEIAFEAKPLRIADCQ